MSITKAMNYRWMEPGRQGSPVHGFRFSATAVLAGAFLLSMPLVLRAGSLPDDGDDAQAKAQVAPDARAARLSSVEGQVRVIQGGQVVADPAYANMPLFAGTQITTGNDGRAEIQLEDGGVARVSPNSSVTLSALDRQGSGTRTELTVNGGLCYFELQPSSSSDDTRVRFGPVSFSASSFSVVRVTLDKLPGEVAVFSGNVHLDQGDAMQVDVHGGEDLALNANDPNHYELNETIASDSWDSWNADRDQALNAQNSEKTAASGKYNNSGAEGFSDLDANGNWYDVPGQGYVWSPYDAQATGASWDPYGYGRWVNYPSYGYLWVSGYDWGYAPFACGAWNFYNGFGWGWAPGSSCMPWWSNYAGGYPYGGWGYNVGNGPRGYLPPRRPVPTPVHPRPVGGGGHMHPLQQASVITVDHRTPGGGELALNPQRFTHPEIAGHSVEPMRPVAPRQTYNPTAAGFVNRPAGPVGMHPVTGGNFGRVGEPGGFHPNPSGPGYVNRGVSAPSYVSHPSGGSSSFHSSSPSGGGGSFHSSGGGAPSGGGMPAGGGGGGGGHPSGGGGGSHH